MLCGMRTLSIGPRMFQRSTMSGGHFLTASQRSSNFALQWTAGTYLLMALSQVISRELNVLSGKRLKLFATTRLDQPPRLDQPQSQRQRLRNLDHRNTLFDQPQDQRKGATLVNPSSRTTRNGPSRTSRREIDAIKIHSGIHGVNRGGRSPSIRKRHLGQNGVEVFTTSAS